nr:hypothetical protein [Tanacetum cinerariifolium]
MGRDFGPGGQPYKEREYASEDESVRDPNNNEEGQIPPNDEVFEDEPISDDDGVPETVTKNGAGHMASPSLSHPPGFTPAVSKNNNKKTTHNGDTDSNEVHATSAGINTNVVNSPGDASVASFSEQVGHQFNNTGGSVLDIMEGFIKVGQAMRYTMDGCAKDLERIIEHQGEDNVFR